MTDTPGGGPYKAVQIAEGSWYALRDYTHTECCDCGLVHREEFKLENGVIYWRAKVDKRRTREARKARKVAANAR